MSNVAGKAYAMNVVTPMRPWLTWINRAAFMASRAFPQSLQGLLGLGLIHFARWVIIRRDQWPQRGQPPQRLVNDYMLFCSNFNGTWDQYIDAFADGLPSGLDLLWVSSTKYPHSIPITPFKNYIRANQIDTGYYYNATPGSAQRDVKAALALAAAVRAVEPGASDDTALGAAYDALLLRVQGQLGRPGYAPIASCDTAAADRNRADAVRVRWGTGGMPPHEAARVAGPAEAKPAAGPSGETGERIAVAAVVERVLARPRRAPPATAPSPGTPPMPATQEKPGA